MVDYLAKRDDRLFIISTGHWTGAAQLLLPGGPATTTKDQLPFPRQAVV
ncbi:hypothetical protein AB0L13_29200 [Saccharopolyspora shandongensis]